MNARQAPAIHIAHVTFAYNALRILDDASCAAPGGRTTVILGRSGVGKSTLLRLLVGLERPQAGEVRIGDQVVHALAPEALRDLRRRIGLCFQTGALLNSMSVEANVGFPMERARSYSPAQVRARVREVLEIVGLGDKGSLMPAELSGGMRKRAGLARALALDPEILLFDEPTTGLDPILGAGIRDLILRLKDRDRTIVVVTHNLETAFAIADHMVMLHEGVVHAEGTPDEIRSNRDGYVRQFLEGRPDS